MGQCLFSGFSLVTKVVILYINYISRVVNILPKVMFADDYTNLVLVEKLLKMVFLINVNIFSSTDMMKWNQTKFIFIGCFKVNGQVVHEERVTIKREIKFIDRVIEDKLEILNKMYT